MDPILTPVYRHEAARRGLRACELGDQAGQQLRSGMRKPYPDMRGLRAAESTKQRSSSEGTCRDANFLIGAGATVSAAAMPGSVLGAGCSPHALDGAAPSVVIVGAGIAGLGCAYRLWRRHGIRAAVYEYNTVPGGRIRTLRGFFDDQQIVEEHAEFINPEHTKTLALAKSFGLGLDNTDKYPTGDTRQGRDIALRWAELVPSGTQQGLARLGVEAVPRCRFQDSKVAGALQLLHPGSEEVRPDVGLRVDRRITSPGV